MRPMYFSSVSANRGGGKGILISDGFCPTLTGSILYVMTEVEDEEDMHTDRHEGCNEN